MKDKVLSQFNIISKLTILFVAIVLIVGTSNGSEIKVSNNNLNLSLDLNAMSNRVEENIKNDI